MALFKAKALPVVLKDIVASIGRASHNSVQAVALLHDFVRVDPPNFKLEKVASLLARDVFRLREECYPAKDMAQLLQSIRVTNGEMPQRGPTYWAIYAHLLALLPALVERLEVRRSRWTAEEYRQLEIACFSNWYDVHDKKDDQVIWNRYNRIQMASKAWFNQTQKLAAALDFNEYHTVNDILASFPHQLGTVREMGFRFAVEELISSLYLSFNADLAEYYFGAEAYGFFSWDPMPPRLNDPESKAAHEAWLRDLTR
jgi:hypothetical protein